MKNSPEEKNNSSHDIPLLLRRLLILIAVAMPLPLLLKNIIMDNFMGYLFFILNNLIIIPGFFVLAGFFIKFRDSGFKLENAYFLGLLMSIVLSVQLLKH